LTFDDALQRAGGLGIF